MKCEICGRPRGPYPTTIISHGHEYHVSCLADRFRVVVDAVKVLVLTPNIRLHLEAHDPKALEQALNAIRNL